MYTDLDDKKKKRIRRVKKALRFLPRKATLHNYPILKYFEKFARKRDYLWSFRVKNVRLAMYAGWLLACFPGIGFHTIASILLSFILRTNIMILVGIQGVVANPLTMIPLWTFEYYIGNYVLKFVDNMHIFEKTYHNIGFSWDKKADVAISSLLAIIIGGFIFGTISAFISMKIYAYFAKKNK